MPFSQYLPFSLTLLISPLCRSSQYLSYMHAWVIQVMRNKMKANYATDSLSATSAPMGHKANNRMKQPGRCGCQFSWMTMIPGDMQGQFVNILAHVCLTCHTSRRAVCPAMLPQADSLPDAKSRPFLLFVKAAREIPLIFLHMDLSNSCTSISQCCILHCS